MLSNSSLEINDYRIKKISFHDKIYFFYIFNKIKSDIAAFQNYLKGIK